MGAWTAGRRYAVATALVAVVGATLLSVGGAAGSTGALAWRTVARDPAVSSRGQVTNLSCTPAGFCLAVGLTGQTAAWGGSSWRPAPTIGHAVAFVSGVSCVTSSFCVAIGSSSTTKRTVNYAVTWTGSDWRAPVKLYTDMGEGGEYDLVHGVSCTAAISAWFLETSAPWCGTAAAGPNTAAPPEAPTGTACSVAPRADSARTSTTTSRTTGTGPRGTGGRIARNRCQTRYRATTRSSASFRACRPHSVWRSIPARRR